MTSRTLTQVLPDGTVTNEGCLSGWAKWSHTKLTPFDIPFSTMLPKFAEAVNLLVSAALSATHAGEGTIATPRTRTVAHTHTYAHTHSHTHPHAFSLSQIHTSSFTYTHTRSLTHGHTHSLTHTYTYTTQQGQVL